MQGAHRTVGQMHAVDDRGGGRQQVEVELAGQPLLDDFEMQQAEKAAAKAEAQRHRGFGLVFEAGVVEAQFGEAVAQPLVIGGVGREQAAEHDRLHRLEAGQGRGGGAAVLGDRVADAAIGDGLDAGGDEADLARPQRIDRNALWGEDADPLDGVHGTGRHQPDFLPGLQRAVLDPHQNDDAEIGVVPAVDQQCLERRCGVARGRRQPGHQGFEHALDVEPGLGRDQHRIGGVEPDHILDLLPDPLGLGRRQVDLVQHRDDLVPGLDRLIDIGQGLRLDPLAGVDDQQRALAGGQGAADLIGEIDMPRRVHQIEDIALTVLGAVLQSNGLRLDGDAALALELHVVEHLLAHLARLEPAAGLDQPVGQGRLAVVDMRDDREIADLAERGHARPNIGVRRRRINAGRSEAASHKRGERDAERLRRGQQAVVVAGKLHRLASPRKKSIVARCSASSVRTGMGHGSKARASTGLVISIRPIRAAAALAPRSPCDRPNRSA